MLVIVEEKVTRKTKVYVLPAHTMKEYRPQPSNQSEQHKPQHEGGNGVPGLPPDSRAYPTLPQKSALDRAVEGTRDLYERNGWVFLPFSAAGKDSSTLPSRPPTTIFYSPSLYNLIEEPKKGDNTQTPQEVRMDSAKVPQSHNKTKQPLDSLARAMREAAQREGKDLRPQTERMLLSLNDHEEDVLRRRFGIPSDHPTPSSEDLQRMFDHPSPADEPSSDNKR